MAKVKKQSEPEAKPYYIEMAQSYRSEIALGDEVMPGQVSYVVIEGSGLKFNVLPRSMFLREFNRDFLAEEFTTMTKFWAIAMRKKDNDPAAIALMERMFNMKLKDLKGKTMAELVDMHNDLAKAANKPTVVSFKSEEAARLAIVKLANTKGTPSTKTAKATGKGAEGRPRTGVGTFAKDLLAKGKSNAEVLEAVKKEFPKNSTTLSCIAYYRAKMVKAGTLDKTVKSKPAKAVKTSKKGKPEKKSKKAKVPAATEQAQEGAQA